MREELGVAESGLVAPDPRRLRPARPDHASSPSASRSARAWHLKRGGTAYDAAGEIHTDIQQGFVKAEVINCQQLIDARRLRRRPRQGHAAASKAATTSMQDGDVITVKHTG